MCKKMSTQASGTGQLPESIEKECTAPGLTRSDFPEIDIRETQHYRRFCKPGNHLALPFGTVVQEAPMCARMAIRPAAPSVLAGK
jgi:hypothetical protein